MQRVGSNDEMTNLLNVLRIKKSSKKKVKMCLIKVAMELDRLITAAAKQSPAIATQENYQKAGELKVELLQTEQALEAKNNPLNKKERAWIDAALQKMKLAVEDEARAATTDEETADEEDPEEENTMDEDDDAVPDVERTQMPLMDDAPELVRRAYGIIMSNEGLRKMLRFDLAPFLLRVHEHATQNMAASQQMQYGALDYGDTIKMYGGGKTQARKTPLKLCAFIMCRMMGVATIVLTTNTSGRDDLFGKFLGLLGELTVPTLPATLPIGANDAQYHYYRVKERGEGGRETTKIVLRKASASSSSAARAQESALAEGVIAINDIGRTESARNWACRQLSQGACIVVNNAAPAIGARSTATPCPCACTQCP